MKIRWANIVFVINYLISIVLLGMVSWISAGFDFNYLKSSEFLFDMGITSLAYTITLISTVLWAKEHEEQVNEVVKLLVKQITIIFQNVVIRKTLQEYVYKVNRKNKTIAWKDLIENKIESIEMKRSVRDEEIYNSDDDKLKRKNKYCRLMKRYEVMMTPEYIEKNINHLKVKYDILTMKMLMGSSIRNRSSDNSYTKTGWQMLKDLSPKFIFSWAMTIFVASFRYTFNTLDASTIINTLAKLGGLLTQIGNGISYGKEYVKEYVIKDLTNSKGHLEDYMIEYNYTVPKM